MAHQPIAMLRTPSNAVFVVPRGKVWHKTAADSFDRLALKHIDIAVQFKMEDHNEYSFKQL
jgi:hypothetical protein